MDRGWVKLHRKMMDNYFLRHDKNAFFVFIHLLMLVGQEKGQWSGGRRQLASMLDMNESTLRHVLERLINEGMIAIDSKTRYSVITIKNWSIYQSKPNGGQQRSRPKVRPAQIQGSLEDLRPKLRPTRDPHETHTRPLYKELEGEKEIKGSDLETQKKGQRASPETVKKAREQLIAKLEAKKGKK